MTTERAPKTEQSSQQLNFDIDYFNKSLDKMKQSHETIIQLLKAYSVVKNDQVGSKKKTKLAEEDNVTFFKHARYVADKCSCKYNKNEELAENELSDDQEFFIE